MLKGEQAKPTFKPSGMDEETAADARGGGHRGRGSPEETPRLEQAQQDPAVDDPPGDRGSPPVQSPPTGSRFGGHRDFLVQGLKIEPFNTRYRLAVAAVP